MLLTQEVVQAALPSSCSWITSAFCAPSPAATCLGGGNPLAQITSPPLVSTGHPARRLCGIRRSNNILAIFRERRFPAGQYASPARQLLRTSGAHREAGSGASVHPLVSPLP